MNNCQTEYKTTLVIPSSPPTPWVRVRKYETAGQEVLNIPKRYAILLVMDGEVTLTFEGYPEKTIGNKSLIVIDHKQLINFRWKASTVVLEFIPPEMIFRFFGSCSRAFSMPCSAIVPILPELQQWADDLIVDGLKPPTELDDTCHLNYCMRLSGILKAYPPLLVGELLVAFQACAMSGKGKCRDGVCNKTEIR